ncbi:hypothetical protein TWF281_002460 [Arthrobotrys megalospora]
MRLLQALVFATSASAAVIVFPRDRIIGCNNDNCMNAINKLGQGDARLADCSSFVKNHKITSYIYSRFSTTRTIDVPATITTLITKPVTVESGSTEFVTITTTVTQAAIIPRGDEFLEFERRQELPFGIPSWAGNCKSKAGTEAAFRFSSACSCFFRTASLEPVTMPTVIATISVTETFSKTRTLTETSRTTTDVPVTTVVNVETQTKQETTTVAAPSETPGPVVEYYLRVADAYAGRPWVVPVDPNTTYKDWYIAGDPRPFSDLAFTITPNREEAIKFGWQSVESDYDDGYLTYQLGEQQHFVTVEDGENKPPAERISLISANELPLAIGTNALLLGKDDGDLVALDPSYFNEIIYYDNDEEKYGDRAGRLWLDSGTVDVSPGITLLSFKVEEILPDPEEP